jgi:hypothetical protein
MRLCAADRGDVGPQAVGPIWAIKWGGKSVVEYRFLAEFLTWYLFWLFFLFSFPYTYIYIHYIYKSFLAKFLGIQLNTLEYM